jgi:hypothetical protein
MGLWALASCGVQSEQSIHWNCLAEQATFFFPQSHKEREVFLETGFSDTNSAGMWYPRRTEQAT